MDIVNIESGDSGSTSPKIVKAEKNRKGKLIILGSWFVSLVGIRLLIASVLDTAWFGTVGAVALTFAAFYLALRYTPLARYSKDVNSALRDWYTKKFIFSALAISMVILSVLVFLVEFGYAYHAERLISVDRLNSDVRSFYYARMQFSSSLRTLQDQGYSDFDAFSILLASVDKSLDGYYLKAVSFILAEDIEILAFLTVFRRTRGSIFGPSRSSNTTAY
jgi:hypothetical protein